MSQKSSFRGPFDKWHGKPAGTLLKSERRHLYQIYWSLWKPFTGKNSLLVICKNLRLFVNPLTSDDKYSLLNRGNLLQHVQVQLSQKRKNFSEFVFAFSKLRFNFEYFVKKDEPHSSCIFELTDSEIRG